MSTQRGGHVSTARRQPAVCKPSRRLWINQPWQHLDLGLSASCCLSALVSVVLLWPPELRHLLLASELCKGVKAGSYASVSAADTWGQGSDCGTVLCTVGCWAAPTRCQQHLLSHVLTTKTVPDIAKCPLGDRITFLLHFTGKRGIQDCHSH